MSKLGDAMGQMFGNGGPQDFRGQLGALKREHGTVTAMARALGVDRRTIQRWESGKIRNPKPATTQKVARAWREAKVSGKALPSDSGVKVDFTQRGRGGRDRHRTVSGDRLALEPGTMGHVRDAYVAGGQEGAARAFVDGIGDDWYHELFEDDVAGELPRADDSSSDPAPQAVAISA